jgi:cobalt/nickel transport protein
MKTRKLWLGLFILALLSPLGLIVPAWLGARTPWGEWSNEEIGKLAGHVPSGLAKLSGIWKAPLPDYAPTGREGAGLATQSLNYLASAIIGVVIVVAVSLILGRILRRKDNNESAGLDE